MSILSTKEKKKKGGNTLEVVNFKDYKSFPTKHQPTYRLLQEGTNWKETSFLLSVKFSTNKNSGPQPPSTNSTGLMDIIWLISNSLVYYKTDRKMITDLSFKWRIY